MREPTPELLAELRKVVATRLGDFPDAVRAILDYVETLTAERDATRKALDRATGPLVLNEAESVEALAMVAEAQQARADKAEAELAAERGRREHAEDKENEARNALVDERRSSEAAEVKLAQVRVAVSDCGCGTCEDVREILDAGGDAVPSCGGERRVFEGTAEEDSTRDVLWWGLWEGDDVSCDASWLEELEGKRVRLTVEVLPEPEKP
jgi:hypothetical protein